MDYAATITASAAAIGEIAKASGEWAKFLCSTTGQKLVEAMITNDEKFRAAVATGWGRIGADVKHAFENIKALFTMSQ